MNVTDYKELWDKLEELTARELDKAIKEGADTDKLDALRKNLMLITGYRKYGSFSYQIV